MALKGEQYGFSQQTNYLAHTWLLKDFSKIVSAYAKPGAVIRSKTFEPGKESVAQIYLSMYPGGETEDEAEYVSVYVMADGGVRTKVFFEKYTLCVKTSHGKVICRRNSSVKVGNVGPRLAFLRFAKRKVLLEQLPDDVLVVFLEMRYSLSIVTQGSGNVKDVAERSPIFAAEGDFWSALNNGKHSDVQIFVGETQIPAHKFVLAARSKVFSAMLDHELLEDSPAEIDISYFDASTVRSMLRFMYSGTIKNLDIPLAFKLLGAVDVYDISGLKSFCSNFLISQLDEENVVKVLIVADLSNAEELLEESIDYLCDKNNSVDFEKYESMLSDHPKLLVKLLAQMRKK